MGRQSKMELKEIKISEIKPYEKNTKKHPEEQIENVMESIRQFGFVQPLVLDDKNVIVIGHCRFEAAKKLGMETLPCYIAKDLSEKQIRRLRIIDNKSNESAWDYINLDFELADLDFDGFSFDFGHELTHDEDFFDGLLTEAEQKEKESKQIQCPHCGEWFEQ